MKNRLVWYVDSVVDVCDCGKTIKPESLQSQHVATVVILIEKMVTNERRYRIGVAVKHPKDKLPFIKREGRRLATERAQNSIPVFSVAEAAIEAWNGVKDLAKVDATRLLSNVQHVLKRV